MAINPGRPLYLVLRQSPDWSRQTYADLESTKEFCRIIKRPENFVIDAVKLWDRTFKTSFFETRQAMKEISLKNFASIEGGTLVSMEQIRGRLDPDAFYLFTDDDDWFDPAIGRVFEGIDPRTCNAVIWLWSRLDHGFHTVNPQEPWLFYPNNYAVSGSVVTERKGNFALVCQHFDAQATFVRKSYYSVLRRIGYRNILRRLLVRNFRPIIVLDDVLSMENKHHASTLMMESLGNDFTPERLYASVKKLHETNVSASIPESCAWVEPYVRQVNAFFRALLEKVR